MQRWLPKSHWFFSAVALIYVLVLTSSSLITQLEINSLKLFSLDRIFVPFHPGATASEIREAQSHAGGKIIKTISAIKVQIVPFPDGNVLDAKDYIGSIQTLSLQN